MARRGITFFDLNFFYSSKVLAFLDYISSHTKARDKIESKSFQIFFEKMRDKWYMTNHLPPIWLLIQKLDHNSSLRAKIRAKSLKTRTEHSSPPPFVWKCGHSPFFFSRGPSVYDWMKILNTKDTFITCWNTLDV